MCDIGMGIPIKTTVTSNIYGALINCNNIKFIIITMWYPSMHASVSQRVYVLCMCMLYIIMCSAGPILVYRARPDLSPGSWGRGEGWARERV